MSLSQRHVEVALDRWERAGLLDAPTGERLRAEARAHEAMQTRRRARYLIASVAAFALFLAASFFAARAWPLLDDATRTLILLVAGAAVYALGSALELRRRWFPSALLLQAGGLAVLLVATIYSAEHWPHGGAGGIAFGIVALVSPMVVLIRFHGRDPITHALHTAFAFPFAAVFLTRAGGLDFDIVVWILDGLAVAAVAALALRLPALEREDADSALAALSAALLSGLVLALLTGLGPLDLGERGVLPADAWLVLMAVVTLWGLHRAPSTLRRGWFETQLALCVLLAVPLVAFTTIEALDWPIEASALAQAALGALALRYGLRFATRGVLVGGALALAVGAWIYGLERGEALGTIGALVATAALLFWVSTRIRDTAHDAET